MGCRTVFIISEDPAVRDSLSDYVISAEVRTRALPSLGAWVATLVPEPGSCIVLDTRVGDLVDAQRRAQFAAVCARLPVVVVTDRGDVPTAVRALKEGAVDVIQRPLQGQNLLERIKRAVAGKEHISPVG